MEDAIITATAFAGVALVFKVIADATIRHKLINKDLVNENVKHLFVRPRGDYVLSNLKWGLVLIGIGLAIVIPRFFPYYVRTETMFGLMFLFAGIGFLVYYGVAKGKIEEDKDYPDKP